MLIYRRTAVTLILLAVIMVAAITSLPLAAQGGMLAPSSISVTASGNDVTVSWARVDEAVKYDLWYWLNLDEGWKSLSDSVKSTSYVHSGLPAGSKPWYIVRGVNADGVHGPWSAMRQVTVTVGPEETPAATETPASTITPTTTAIAQSTATPTSTTAPSSGRTVTVSPDYEVVEDSVLVTWNAPANCSASHYILTRTHTEQGVEHTDTFTIDGAATSYTDTDAETHITYEYALTAHCSDSAATSTPTATPTPTTAAEPTATPTPTATPEKLPGLSCIFIEESGSGYHLQAASVTAFTERYGSAPSSPQVDRAGYNTDSGVFMVGYVVQASESKEVTIWESWKNCQFSGVQIEDGE